MNGMNKNGSETDQQIQLELHADWVPAFIAQEVIFDYILPKNNLSNPKNKDINFNLIWLTPFA